MSRSARATSTSQSQGSTRYGPWAALVVVALGYFMNVLDSTAVNVAVPSIVTDLDASAVQILWVLNGYLFTFAMLLLLGGRLGDILGHRNVFSAGLLLFTLSSLGCALAGSPEALIAGRVLQGVGAAAAAPQAIAITAAVFPPERRAMAFGVLASVIGSAAAAGPILGGVLTDVFSWRAIFYLNVPIGLAGLVAAFVVLPVTRQRGGQRLPIGSAVLASVGMFAMLYALIEGERHDWASVWGPIQVWHLLAFSVVVLLGFMLRERVKPQGLLPRAIFTSRNYALMVWASIATYFGIFGTQLVLTIYLQSALGASPLQAGLVLAPMWVAASLTAPLAGRLATRLAEKSLVVAGLSIFSLGTVLTAMLPYQDAPWWGYTLPLIVAGAGAGLTFAPVTSIAMQEVTPDAFGGASGLIEVVRQVGAAMCIAAVGAILQAVWITSMRDRAAADAADLPEADREAVASGADRLADRGLDAGSGSSVSELGPGVVGSVLEQASQHGLIAAAGPALLVTAAVVASAVFSSAFVHRRDR